MLVTRSRLYGVDHVSLGYKDFISAVAFIVRESSEGSGKESKIHHPKSAMLVVLQSKYQKLQEKETKSPIEETRETI